MNDVIRLYEEYKRTWDNDDNDDSPAAFFPVDLIKIRAYANGDLYEAVYMALCAGFQAGYEAGKEAAPVHHLRAAK